MNNSLYLLDKEFLNDLDLYPHREVFARITTLDIEENPLEYIEGKVTGGSINVEGNSAVRRTCNLTLTTQEININEFLWGIKTKFKLEVGLKNVINSKYPEICWFPQGVYVITAFNASMGTNNYQVAISGKDKMCLLNGDLGGNLPASIDFGKEEKIVKTYTAYSIKSEADYETNKYYVFNGYKAYDGVFDEDQEYYTKDSLDNYSKYNGSYFQVNQQYYIKQYKIDIDRYNSSKTYYVCSEEVKYIQLPLYRIIKEAVHAWANEPYHNIVINDLEEFGLEQLTYKGEDPLYIFKAVLSDTYRQMSITDRQCYLVTDKTGIDSDGYIPRSHVDWNNPTYLSSFLFPERQLIQEPGVDEIAQVPVEELTWICFETPSTQEKVIPYTVLVLNYGDDAGYRVCDLVYAGELISSIGETVTSILDKIKNMLGEFEYFYNLDGQFVFQKKPTYLNTSWSSIQKFEDDAYVIPSEVATPIDYSFVGNKIITAFNNSPVINNVKNDYSIWGVRKGVSGADLPIHIRYAIDKKPKFYHAFDGTTYLTDPDTLLEQIKEQLRTSAENQINNKIKNFELKYADSMPSFFPRPVQREDGSWTAGWWDIRDWRDFHIALTNEVPRGTLKFYASQDSLNNSQNIYDLFHDFDGALKSDVNNYNVSNYYLSYGNTTNYRVWLAQYNSNTRYITFSHGAGTPTGNMRQLAYYESFLNEEPQPQLNTFYSNLGPNGGMYTQLSTQEPSNTYKSYKTNITRGFDAPQTGCSDWHTYEYFYESYNIGQEDGWCVYFYNPEFPEAASTKDLIEQKINELYEKYLNKVKVVDWREIIYQMALDYFRYSNADTIDAETNLPYKDVFLQKVSSNNLDLYPTGYTGYEQYYTDLQGFWRQLYNPDAYPVFSYDSGYVTKKRIYHSETQTTAPYYEEQEVFIPTKIKGVTIDYYIPTSVSIEFRSNEIHFNYIVGQEVPSWFTELHNYSERYYGTSPVSWEDNNYTMQNHYYFDEAIKQLIRACVTENDSRKYWNIAVFEAPETLNFWFDFLDSESELASYAVPTIGDRSKVVNDTKVTGIYFKEIPSFIFTTNETFTRKQYENKTGYTFLFLPKAMMSLFDISYRGKSAKNELDNLLYQHGYCTENITITSLPVYHLKPNTRIAVSDENTKINGEYIINKLTIPLTYNGTMQITANKVPPRII